MNNRNLAYDEAAQRKQLIAFYQAESPWMVQKLENLRRGDPLTIDDRNVLAGINAAMAIAA